MTTVNVSPNMGLPVPAVGEDPGPDWATNLVACLTAIDGHNHTAGQGVPITPDAIDINDDLTFAGNNATDVRTVRFTAQAAVLTDPSDNGSLYEAGVDLYYNDGAGNRVRITQSGSVTGSTGTITGLPSGTASASFAGGTFTWESATNVPAIMAVGPLIIGDTVASPNTVTVQSPTSLGASYAVTLPAALPASTYPVTITSTGTLAASGTVLHADGTAGAPAMSFASDTNTGIYRIASDTVAVTAGGTAQVAVSTSAVTAIIPVLEADGSNAAPAYSFSNDTDCGMYRSSTNTLGFSANGIESLTITGTYIAPATQILAASGSVGSPEYSFTGDSNTGIYNITGGEIGMACEGVKRAHLTTDSLTITGGINATGAISGSTIETSGGGAWQVTVLTGTLAANAQAIIFSGSTIYGAVGYSTFNGATWVVMKNSLDDTASSANVCVFGTNGTSTTLEIVNFDTNTTNSYRVMVFHA